MIRWLAIGLTVIAVGAGTVLSHRLAVQFSTTAGTGRPAFIPQTLGFRWTIWAQQYIPTILKRPLTGWGVVLPNSIRWPDPESQYITFLLQGGLPLVLMFVFLFIGMLHEAGRARLSADPVDRAMGEALVVTVVVLGIINFIWPYLSNGGMPQLLWCLFAILAPAVSRSDAHTSLVDPRHSGERDLAAV